MLASQSTVASEALLDHASSHVFVAPHIFPGEVRNLLLMMEWRGRSTEVETSRALAALSNYGVDIEPPPPPMVYDAILGLGRKERLTVYDATYLWTALRGDFTLASRDGALLAAAARNGVAVEDLRPA
jgi:predicted nucleic acid-binding protein